MITSDKGDVSLRAVDEGGSAEPTAAELMQVREITSSSEAAGPSAAILSAVASAATAAPGAAATIRAAAAHRRRRHRVVPAAAAIKACVEGPPGLAEPDRGADEGRVARCRRRRRGLHLRRHALAQVGGAASVPPVRTGESPGSGRRRPCRPGARAVPADAHPAEPPRRVRRACLAEDGAPDLAAQLLYDSQVELREEFFDLHRRPLARIAPSRGILDRVPPASWNLERAREVTKSLVADLDRRVLPEIPDPRDEQPIVVDLNPDEVKEVAARVQP